MSYCARTISAAALVAVLAVPAIGGQKSRRPAALPAYNPAAEVRVKGTIREVTFYLCPVSGGTGAHLRIDTLKQSSLEIHLAPSWFLEKYGMRFRLGERVEVAGVKYARRDEAGLMARQVESAAGIYFFRNREGKPLWLPD